MIGKNNWHDKIFKLGLSYRQVAKEFLQAHLPEHLLRMIDLDDLQIESNSFIDKKYAWRETDVLLKTSISNRLGYIYILREHQSSVDHAMPLRLNNYVMCILNEHEKQNPKACLSKSLPVVMPLVYYNGQRPYCGEQDFFALFGQQRDLAEEVLLKPFRLVDLSQVSNDSLLTFEWYSLMGVAMKYIRSGDDLIEVMIKISPNLSRIEKLGGGEYIALVIQYVLSRCVAFNEQHFRKIVSETLSDELGGEVMTFAEKLFQDGHLEGKAEGMREAKREVAMNLLRSGLDHQIVLDSLELDQRGLDALLATVETISV